MWENAPNAFITVRSSKSLRPLRALQTLTTTERKKAKISNEDDFFIHKRRFFLILVLLSSFRRCWSVFLFHRSKKKKKKFCQRERDVAAEKRERFSFLVETSRTQIKHASSHIITTGVLSSLRFNDTFLRHHFSFQRYSDKRNNVVSFCSFFSRRGLHVFVVAS